MNSKIKMLLGVFFVFALLSPIYAIETPTDVEAISVDDELIEYRPEDDTNTSTGPDLPHGDIEMPGILPDKPHVIVDPIIRPELILNQTEIITKDNYILLTGSLKDLGVTVKYKIWGTTKTGNCRVQLTADTIEEAPEIVTFSAIDDQPSAISPIEEDPIRPILPIVAERITFTCDLNVSDIEGKYKVDVIAENTERLTTTKKVDLIVDRTAPAVDIDSISTRDRTPVLTGTIEDLIDIRKFKLTVNDVIYEPTINDDRTWEIQLETLPRGTHNVEVYTSDRLSNADTKTEEEKITIRTGGGTRIVAEPTNTPTETVTPAPAPETPAAQPVVTEPTITNTPTTPTTPTTGGTPITTPAPTTGNVAAVNPAETSGSTGFLGLPTGASTSIALVIGALLVVGALGYFLFFAKK